MGHSDIGVTLNTYTHLGLEDAAYELKRMEDLENARKELKRIEDLENARKELNKAREDAVRSASAERFSMFYVKSLS